MFSVQGGGGSLDSGDTPCHFRCSCEGPNASRSLIQWVDWAGQRPEGRTPTPTPSRKKERNHAGLYVGACNVEARAFAACTVTTGMVCQVDILPVCA